MATETPISHQTPVSDEPIKTKGNEQETVSGLKDMEVPSQSIPSSETPVVADKKIHDVAVSEPVLSNAVINGQTTAEPVKAAEEKQKVVDAPQSSDNTIAKSEEAPSKSEGQSEGSKQVDEKPQVVVPQSQVKPGEQSEITKQDKEPESAVPDVQGKPEGGESKDENPATVKETVKDESTQVLQDPNLVKDDKKEHEEVKDSVSNVEAEKTDGVKPPVGDKTEEKAKEETPKPDEATTEVSEKAKESEEQGSQVEKEKAEESDVQNKKNEDGSEATGEKATPKQSASFFTKVKLSLAKAKKAFSGKSPNPKAESSDTKE